MILLYKKAEYNHKNRGRFAVYKELIGNMLLSRALNIRYLKMGPSAVKLSCYEPRLMETDMPFLTLLIP